ncbi:hypothetical protein CupriaWKF_10955 [Cupriavidus sp. WKF15]|uniref:hypothetical protein n=1 Tax=Cupriavidus sp. WKF15 TaxID=3032282 RepID=UPI0023E183C4|nr:hypothetical protein [Cupriavidus sp. WKF15]WER44851.1 hypothetical protein CupriaWKF_10955 [Cupriavidus sp. WKF15]
MQIYSLFDAPMRSFRRGRAASADLHIGFHFRLLPACAGPGSTCDYVFLQAGQSQRDFMARRGEWWACLRGGIRIAAPGRDAVTIGCADMLAPMPGMPMQVQSALDSILVRVVPDDSSAYDGAMSFEDTLLQGELSRNALGCVATLRDVVSGEQEFAGSGMKPAPGMRAGFAQLPEGECLQIRGLRWALCHRGALGVRSWTGGETYLNFAQPGTLFVPDPHESYSLEALLPATGLLFCSGPVQAAVPDTCGAARLLPGARPGVVEMRRAPYGSWSECLPA